MSGMEKLRARVECQLETSPLWLVANQLTIAISNREKERIGSSSTYRRIIEENDLDLGDVLEEFERILSHSQTKLTV